MTKCTKNSALSKALIQSGRASIDQVTRGVLYAKFLSIRYVINIDILQDSLIDIDIFQKFLGDNLVSSYNTESFDGYKMFDYALK